MTKLLYVLLNNNNPDPILREEPDDKAFKVLKESLLNTPILGHPTYQIPFFLVTYEKKGDALWYSSQNTGITIDPQGIIASNWTL